MLTLRIDKNLEERLNNLSKKTKRTKSFYVKKAINAFLEEQEDYLMAVEVLKEKNPTYTLEEAKKMLGIE